MNVAMSFEEPDAMTIITSASKKGFAETFGRGNHHPESETVTRGLASQTIPGYITGYR
jgi:hypothetical protein